MATKEELIDITKQAIAEGDSTTANKIMDMIEKGSYDAPAPVAPKYQSKPLNTDTTTDNSLMDLVDHPVVDFIRSPKKYTKEYKTIRSGLSVYPALLSGLAESIPGGEGFEEGYRGIAYPSPLDEENQDMGYNRSLANDILDEPLNLMPYGAVAKPLQAVGANVIKAMPAGVEAAVSLLPKAFGRYGALAAEGGAMGATHSALNDQNAKKGAMLGTVVGGTLPMAASVLRNLPVTKSVMAFGDELAQSGLQKLKDRYEFLKDPITKIRTVLENDIIKDPWKINMPTSQAQARISNVIDAAANTGRNESIPGIAGIFLERKNKVDATRVADMFNFDPARARSAAGMNIPNMDYGDAAISAANLAKGITYNAPSKIDMVGYKVGSIIPPYVPMAGKIVPTYLRGAAMDRLDSRHNKPRR